MKTLYDVQQLLKNYGIFVYLGKRLYDIEMMKIELAAIHQNHLIDQETYFVAELILRREHKIELEKEKKNG